MFKGWPPPRRPSLVFLHSTSEVMTDDVPLRFRRRLVLGISELQETVGRYLSFLSHAAEATAFEPDHSAPSSRPDRVDDESSEAADEVWTTFLNNECMIDVTDAHSDSTEPLLTEHKLQRQLTSNQRRESRANTPSLAPTGETRTSSLAARATNAALCELCECNKCKQKRGKKRKREDSIESIMQAFPRPNLIDFLATYWKTLKEDGLYAGLSFESFQWTLKDGPAHAHPLHHHLILRALKMGDDLHQWRQSFAEIRNLESYRAFFSEAKRQRTTGKQARKRGEKNSDIAHKEYVADIFEGRASPEKLKKAKDDLKRDLQYGRLWSILVDGFADGDDGWVPRLGLGVLILCGPFIAGKMSLS
jgi:hypothetical protein